MKGYQLTRREITTGAAAAVGAYAVSVGAGRSARAAASATFKIGISSPSVSILPVYFAKDGGFADQYGVDLEIVNAEGGTRGIQVLLSGDLQAMHVGLAPVVQANLQGADLRLVAATINTMPFVFYATKKRQPQLPKGSRIGISTFGSETDIAVSVAMKKLDLNRDDYVISQIGGTTERLMAMVAGRIDAAPLLEPAITAAKQRGFVPIIDLAAAHTPWIFDAVVVSRPYGQSKPPALVNFLKSYVEGAMKGLGDPDWAKGIIARRFKSKDSGVVESTWQDYNRLMARDASPSLAGAQNVLAQLKAIKLPVGSDNPNDYLDLSLIDGLKSEGFIAAMQKKYGVKGTGAR